MAFCIGGINMFEKMQDMYLKHCIKSLLQRYYATFGLTMEQVEHMTTKELLDKINMVVANLDKENGYFARMTNTYQNQLTNVQMQNKELNMRYKELDKSYQKSQLENAMLLEEKFKLKLENNMYKDMSQSKGLAKTNVLDMNKNKEQGKTNKLELVK